MQKHDAPGFTLIELLLVVAIAGLIAVVAVPSLTKARDAADSAAAMSQLRSIHANEVMVRVQAGRYARLNELNTFAGNSLGRTVGSTLRRGDFVYGMYPTPTQQSLLSGYRVIAYRIRNGRVISQYIIAQDGLIQTVIP